MTVTTSQEQLPLLSFDIRGQNGEYVVFIHGIGGNRKNWRGQLDHFSDRFRTLAFDLRGYGESPKIADGQISLSVFAEDVLSSLNQLGVNTAHFVGLSMGGLVVQAIYALAPERVKAMVLAACRGGHSPVSDAEGFAAARLAPLMHKHPHAELARNLLPKLHGPSITPEAMEELRDSILSLHLESYKAVVSMRVGLKPFLDLSTISVPTLILGGGQDTLAPPSQMLDIHSRIKGSKLKIFEGCGHFINIERRLEFNLVVKKHFDSVGAAP